jgi:hypothetical protein
MAKAEHKSARKDKPFRADLISLHEMRQAQQEDTENARSMNTKAAATEPATAQAL